MYGILNTSQVHYLCAVHKHDPVSSELICIVWSSDVINFGLQLSWNWGRSYSAFLLFVIRSFFSRSPYMDIGYQSSRIGIIKASTECTSTFWIITFHPPTELPENWNNFHFCLASCQPPDWVYIFIVKFNRDTPIVTLEWEGKAVTHVCGPCVTVSAYLLRKWSMQEYAVPSRGLGHGHTYWVGGWGSGVREPEGLGLWTCELGQRLRVLQQGV